MTNLLQAPGSRMASPIPRAVGCTNTYGRSGD